MTVIDDLLKNNERYADTFSDSGRSAAPARSISVVCCMDARIQLFPALGLEPGDAHVIRNAGGRIADALRSLAVSQLLLGTQEVMIIHHTDCGLASLTDAEIRMRLRAERGVDVGEPDFYAFDDLEQSVRDDIAAYHASPLVRHDIPVRGFVFDVRTGELTEVA